MPNGAPHQRLGELLVYKKLQDTQKKQESITLTQGMGEKRGKSKESEETQLLNLVEFKSTIVNMCKERKENMGKEFRERMRMCHQIKYVHKGIGSIPENQVEILPLRSTTTHIKHSLERLGLD